MANRTTRADVEMVARLDQLDPNSKRYQVLHAAREFKAAWVQMGQRLTLVREAEEFKAWGYDSFEAYCRRELHIRSDTANKLTRSFSFLRDHEPALLTEREPAQLPPLDVVDLMSRTQEQTNLSDDQFGSLCNEVFANEDKEFPSRHKLLKRIREDDEEAFRPAPKGVEGDAKKALMIAERLQQLLKVQSGISSNALSGLEQAIIDLRVLCQQCQQAQGQTKPSTAPTSTEVRHRA